MPVFFRHHLVPQPVNPGVGRTVVLVMRGGEFAEDQPNGRHVLQTVIAISRIVQRADLVDNADR